METLAKDTWETMQLQKEYGRVRSTGVQSAESNYYSVQAQKVGLKRQLREAEKRPLVAPRTVGAQHCSRQIRWPEPANQLLNGHLFADA